MLLQDAERLIPSFATCWSVKFGQLARARGGNRF
jgi:hypothetical protein